MKTLETDRNLKKKRYKILMTAFSVKKNPHQQQQQKPTRQQIL